MSRPPFISVVVLGFQRKQFIIEAVQSILSQTLPRSEIEILTTKRFADSEIDDYLDRHFVKRIYAPTDLQGDAYSMAIQAARGDVLCFLEDDDLFVPEKLQVVQALFQTKPEVGYYHNNYAMIDEKGKSIDLRGYHGSARHWIERNKYVYASGSQTAGNSGDLARVDIDFNPSCISVRRSVLLPFAQRMASLPASMDVALFFAALISRTGLFADNRILTKYRLHSANTSLALFSSRSAHLKHRYEVALKESVTYDAIKRWSDLSTDSDVRANARALVKSHEISVNFLCNDLSRAKMVRTAMESLPYVRTFTWRRRGPLLLMAAAFMASPPLAHSLYFRGLRAGGVFGRDPF